MKWLAVVVGTGAVMLLAACSGGETGTGQTSGKDLAIGTITGFGSVFVNGVKFETTNTDISLEGSATTQESLRIGMVVKVHGTINPDGITGTADTLAAEEEVKGIIDDIINGSALSVLGQTIQIAPDTRFEGFSVLTELQIGDAVEVSGYFKQEGIIAATRVEKRDTLETLKVIGTVRDLDVTGKTFTLAALVVDYSGAALDGFTNNSLHEGDLVKVTAPAGTGTTPLLANKIAIRSLELPDADEFELEGFVTDFVSPASFAVNHVPVHTDAATEFEGGSAADIALGGKLEVEGVLNDGVLTAESVSFAESIKLISRIETINVDRKSFSLAGMAGIDLRVNANTVFSGVDQFAALSGGQYAKIRGSLSADGFVLVTKLEVEELNTEVVLQGTVTSVDQPVVGVLGLIVNTQAIDEGGFETENGEGRVEFFNQIKVGDLVKVSGSLSNNLVVWHAIEQQ